MNRYQRKQVARNKRAQAVEQAARDASQVLALEDSLHAARSEAMHWKERAIITTTGDDFRRDTTTATATLDGHASFVEIGNKDRRHSPNEAAAAMAQRLASELMPAVVAMLSKDISMQCKQRR